MIFALARLARLHHWVKNVFVLVPLPFAMVAGARIDLPSFLLGLLGFSLVSSAVYVVNDILDAEADRLSQKKRSRPIASGAVSVPTAIAFAGMLAAGGLSAAWASGHARVLILTLIYVASNLAYSMRLKHVPLVDVFLLASGYVIRVLLGCALVDVAPSNWLLICASSLALFLAFTKRRADIVAGVALEHRPALAGYTAGFLEQSMAITCGLTLVTYALYSIDAAGFVAGRELAGLPFVAFALLHYLRLAHKEQTGGSPVEAALRSPMLQACAALWLLASLWSLQVFG